MPKTSHRRCLSPREGISHKTGTCCQRPSHARGKRYSQSPGVCRERVWGMRCWTADSVNECEVVRRNAAAEWRTAHVASVFSRCALNAHRAIARSGTGRRESRLAEVGDADLEAPGEITSIAAKVLINIVHTARERSYDLTYLDIVGVSDFATDEGIWTWPKPMPTDDTTARIQTAKARMKDIDPVQEGGKRRSMQSHRATATSASY